MRNCLPTRDLASRAPAGLSLLAALLTAAAAASLGAPWAGGLLLALILGVALGRRVPVRLLLARMIPLLVFGLLALPLIAWHPPPESGTLAVPGLALTLPREPVLRLGWLLGKTALVVLALTAFLHGGGLREVLAGARQLHIPRPLRVMVYLAAYWAGELARQVREMRRAAVSRGEARGLRRLGLAVAMGRTLMVRALRRVDTIALALVARGFTGDLPLLDERTSRAAWALAGAYGLSLAVVVWLSRR